MAKSSKTIKSGWRLSLLAGAAFMVSGLMLLAIFWLGVWRQQTSAVQPTTQALQNNSVKDDTTALVSGIPTRLQIPGESIDLKVIPGYYYPKTQSWTLSTDSAQWGVMTAQANNKQGDTFIYAHAREGLFATLPKVKLGEEAVVKTSNGHKFTYVFRQSQVTTPQDTSLFTYQGKPVLVLQTCTGVWSQNRQLFIFELVKAV
jgi:LPXTG-site transpeptidase (sortase) family protein